MLFLIAGFDTSATWLNYCFYVLTTHQDEMKKLQNEIDNHFENTDLVRHLIL